LALEYEHILKLQASEIGMTEADIDDFVGFLCANSLRKEVNTGIWPMTDDSGDEFLARLALSSGCDYLVTHNTRDFEAIAGAGISVVTPRQILPIIRGQS
jgi:hypothetical protein